MLSVEAARWWWSWAPVKTAREKQFDLRRLSRRRAADPAHAVASRSPAVATRRGRSWWWWWCRGASSEVCGTAQLRKTKDAADRSQVIGAGRQGSFAELPIAVPDAAVVVRGRSLRRFLLAARPNSQARREARVGVLQRASRLRERGDREVSR